MKLLIPALALCWFCLPRCGAGATCQEDVKHMNPPKRASIDEVLGLSGPPLELFFSRNGIDVYSATDFYAIRELRRGGLSDSNAVTVLLIYQDEEIRQRTIESLKDQPVSKERLKSLKFSTWRFELKPMWVNDVLTRKWVVTGTAYFEPSSCEPNNTNSNFSARYLAASINDSNRLMDLMPPFALPKDQQRPPTPNSVLAQALDLMRQKLQAAGLLD
jgi:hypothetical protein